MHTKYALQNGEREDVLFGRLERSLLIAISSLRMAGEMVREPAFFSDFRGPLGRRVLDGDMSGRTAGLKMKKRKGG